MRALAQIGHNTREAVENRSFAIDTTFVLFFLAIEFAQSESLWALDTMLVGITLLMVMALPYFINAEEEKPAFKGLVYRTGIYYGFRAGPGAHVQTSAGQRIAGDAAFSSDDAADPDGDDQLLCTVLRVLTISFGKIGKSTKRRAKSPHYSVREPDNAGFLYGWKNLPTKLR